MISAYGWVSYYRFNRGDVRYKSRGVALTVPTLGKVNAFLIKSGADWNGHKSDGYF